MDEIYENKELVRKICEDVDCVKKNFTHIHSNKLKVNEPLKKEFRSTGRIEKYLTAIDEISKKGDEVTISRLSRYMGIKVLSISNYFYRSKDIIKRYITVKSGTKNKPTKYFLSEMGKDALSLINHFREYFKSILL